MPQLLLLLVFLLSLITACEKTPEAPEPEPSKTQKPSVGPTSQPRPLSETHDAVVVELANEAIPFWRELRDKRPPLVLLSNQSLLHPVPVPLRDEARKLTTEGKTDDFILTGRFHTANPVVLPENAVRLALQRGFFSRLVWIFPTKLDQEQLTIDALRDQLLQSGAISEEEAQTLSFDNGAFRGLIEGLPFEVYPSGALPSIEEPCVLHIDLSFFVGLYSDEIKTPIYPMLHQTLTNLREGGMQPYLASLSYSTVEGHLPLDTRFAITRLAAALKDPRLLEGNMPRTWGPHADILYRNSFLQNGFALDTYLALAEEDPQDSIFQYGLYLTYSALNEGEKAFEALERAVALDPGYAYEFLQLAQHALEQKLPRQSLAMLEKAHGFFPEQAFIALRMVQFYVDMKNKDAALELLNNLRYEDWSLYYHGWVPGWLDKMEMQALALTSDPTEEEAGPSEQTIAPQGEAPK